MSDLSYLDFDLTIEKSGDLYVARVTGSPAGEASVTFSAPFNAQELEIFFLRIGQPRSVRRRIDSPGLQFTREYGERLFNTVFTDEVYACLQSSMNQALQHNQGLRLLLRIHATELADLPWEYLYDPHVNAFLSLSVESPLVRYHSYPRPIQVLKVTPPLRLLVIISDPADYPPINVEEEWARLNQALAPLLESKALEVELVSPATLDNLQHQLRRKEAHIIHFIGHGGFDVQVRDGLLIFKDENGRGRAINGTSLGTLLHDERTLRLVVLNACEGARTSPEDPYAGVAYSLIKQGIPAVIAMQFEITDQAAITLAYEFYAAIADGFPVDAALAEARKAIFADGNETEWGTPVLFTSTRDGRIFEVAKVDRVAQATPPPTPAIASGSTSPPDFAPPVSSGIPPARADDASLPAMQKVPVAPALTERARSRIVSIGIMSAVFLAVIAFLIWGVPKLAFIQAPTDTPAPSNTPTSEQQILADVPLAFTSTPTPSFTTTSTADPTPPATPIQTNTPSACPGAVASQIRIDMDAKVCTKKENVNVFLEDLASTDEVFRHRPVEDFRLYRIDKFNTPFKVVDGPKCGGNSTWWQIELLKGRHVIKLDNLRNTFEYVLKETTRVWVQEGSDETDRYFICPVPEP